MVDDAQSGLTMCPQCPLPNGGHRGRLHIADDAQSGLNANANANPNLNAKVPQDIKPVRLAMPSLIPISCQSGAMLSNPSDFPNSRPMRINRLDNVPMRETALPHYVRAIC